LITRATLQLQRVSSPWMQVWSRRFHSLQDFADLTVQAEQKHEHVVAWLDTSSHQVGRGILIQASHAASLDTDRSRVPGEPHLAMPLVPPFSLVSRPVVRAFNEAYFHRVPTTGREQRVHAYPFMFPLDGVRDWNRIYGPRGFYQYQCVVPAEGACETMQTLLEHIARSGQCSFLTVLKRLGSAAPVGLLSFAREGWTLALDFPDGGLPLLKLFDELDAVVSAAGGHLYPAKDARMSATMFRRGFPGWEHFSRWVDPAFSSAFWRRVTAP
jgi:hypothetical protein